MLYLEYYALVHFLLYSYFYLLFGALLLRKGIHIISFGQVFKSHLLFCFFFCKLSIYGMKVVLVRFSSASGGLGLRISRAIHFNLNM